MVYKTKFGWHGVSNEIAIIPDDTLPDPVVQVKGAVYQAATSITVILDGPASIENLSGKFYSQWLHKEVLDAIATVLWIAYQAEVTEISASSRAIEFAELAQPIAEGQR